MKFSLLFLSLSLLAPVAVMADETEQAPPHIFTDLNGNGISDFEENLSPGANPTATGIDQVELPPTPPDEEAPQ